VKAPQSALRALERPAQLDGDPTRALHDAVEAIGKIAALQALCPPVLANR